MHIFLINYQGFLTFPIEFKALYAFYFAALARSCIKAYFDAYDFFLSYTCYF